MSEGGVEALIQATVCGYLVVCRGGGRDFNTGYSLWISCSVSEGGVEALIQATVCGYLVVCQRVG